MRAGYFGPEGTYTQEALLADTAGLELETVPLPTIYDTVMAVHDGLVDTALVPIENSLEGSVNATLDALAMETDDVAIVGEVVQPIRHCLIARTSLELAEIETVVSHPQANAQCARFIRTRLPQARVLAGSSTADAVRVVAGHDGPWAALGNRLAAERYGCLVLRAGVEDRGRGRRSMAAVGSVQAAWVLMGPFLAALMGISLVTVPEAARLLKQSPRKLKLFCLAIGGGMALAALLWGIVLQVALPIGVGHIVLRSLWRLTYPLVLPVTIWVMATCLTVGASAGLRALGASRRSLRAMIISSVMLVVASVLGAMAGDALGAVRGMAIGGVIAVLAWWWQLRAALREANIASEGIGLIQSPTGRHRAPSAVALRRSARSDPAIRAP